MHDHRWAACPKPEWTDCSVPPPVPPRWPPSRRRRRAPGGTMWRPTLHTRWRQTCRALSLRSDRGVRALEKRFCVQPCQTRPRGRRGALGCPTSPYRKCFVHMWRRRWQMTAHDLLRPRRNFTATFLTAGMSSRVCLWRVDEESAPHSLKIWNMFWECSAV